MKVSVRRIASIVIFACLLGSVSASAQDAATIFGTVTDPSGAVVPNVNVEVTNPDKGFKRVLVSDSAGEYVAAKVPIGSYVITAEAAGFQKLVRSGFTLQVGQLLRVDLKMEVGATTQAVTVVANAPQVQTDSGALSFVVGGTQMVDLDLNGRGFLNLELLAPGVSEANNGINFETPQTPTITFDGLRGYNNRTEIDGMTDIDMGNTESNAVLPSPDAIAEFCISTNNFGADIGQAGGAFTEVATESGTREFHGGMYEFVRNTGLTSNDLFANRVINPPAGMPPRSLCIGTISDMSSGDRSTSPGFTTRANPKPSFSGRRSSTGTCKAQSSTPPSLAYFSGKGISANVIKPHQTIIPSWRLAASFPKTPRRAPCIQTTSYPLTLMRQTSLTLTFRSPTVAQRTTLRQGGCLNLE